MIKARIVKNIQYSQGLKIISEAIVKKKSNWLGIWRTRKAILFGNKMCFFRGDSITEDPTTQIFLSDISKLEGGDEDPTLLMIFYVDGCCCIKFDQPQVKEQWKQSISKAIRSYKVKQSQFLTRNRVNSAKEPTQKGCMRFF